MELVRSSVSIVSGLPRVTVRSAPAIVFSRPAQRSLALRPARSRSRQATLYTEGSDSFVASAAASIATGWSEPVPGRELHPLKSSAFHGALLRQLYARRGCQGHQPCGLLDTYSGRARTCLRTCMAAYAPAQRPTSCAIQPRISEATANFDSSANTAH